MSAIRALERMLAAGVPMETAIEVAKGFEDDLTEVMAALAREMARDPKAEARKAKDAERQRLKRASKDNDDIQGHPQTSVDVQNEEDDASRAHVVNTPSSLRSEDKPSVSPNGLTAPKGANNVRGTRLPEGWEPGGDDWLRAMDLLGGDVGAVNELDRFRDYWRAVPGAKGRKTDWPATWRNWVRRASENSARKAHVRPHHDAKFEARQANLATLERGADLAARLRGEP